MAPMRWVVALGFLLRRVLACASRSAATMVRTTRTLNPLPFHDLEPHRFEDLVRQLAYDLRHWKSLEATGRGGADDGLDIRAIEIAPLDEQDEDDDDTSDAAEQAAVAGSRGVERLWVFQCKREKSLTPKRLREVIAESLSSLPAAPHGFVLAVACDVSKKARDAFREGMVGRGVDEFSLWAKGELEDMLFQPKNDRLLFAYFGISLTTRRRSMATEHRSNIARKKQLTALLGESNSFGKLVLLRDPSDTRYPTTKSAPSWLLVRAMHARAPGCLTFRCCQHLAALTPDGNHWDALLEHDAEAAHTLLELQSSHAWAIDERASRQYDAADDFWNEYISEADRAFLKVYRRLPFERVIAIDALGDGFYPVPHILVDFDNALDPFSDSEWLRLEPYGGNPRIMLHPTSDNRKAIFPHPLPGVDDPVPSAFDDTLDQVQTPSPATTEKLSTVLAQIAIDRAQARAPGSDAKLSETAAELMAFKHWRDTLALPLLSGFVARLRSAGHSARVVVRCADSRSDGGANESVAVHVRLRMRSQFNPNYRPSGHVSVSLPAFGGLRISVWPSRDGATVRDGYANLQLEKLDQNYLEREVVAMLERLSRGR